MGGAGHRELWRIDLESRRATRVCMKADLEWDARLDVLKPDRLRAFLSRASVDDEPRRALSGLPGLELATFSVRSISIADGTKKTLAENRYRDAMSMWSPNGRWEAVVVAPDHDQSTLRGDDLALVLAG